MTRDDYLRDLVKRVREIAAEQPDQPWNWAKVELAGPDDVPFATVLITPTEVRVSATTRTRRRSRRTRTRRPGTRTTGPGIGRACPCWPR